MVSDKQIPPTIKTGERNGVHNVLVVSRNVGERVLIGDKIAVTVVKVGSGGVRIGIEAPTEMAVIREELAEQLRLAEALTIETVKPATSDSKRARPKES